MISYLGNITTGAYGSNWFCAWTIAPANASRVILTISDFLTEGPAAGTQGDWAYVWECSDSTCAFSKLLGSFAGTTAVIPPSITSTTGVMRVQFFSDGSWTRSGFRASYRTPCPPGSFGPGLPRCVSCRVACPAGMTLQDSCGGYDSVADSKCVCPAGQIADGPASSCLSCGTCGPGAASRALLHFSSRAPSINCRSAGSAVSDFHDCKHGPVCGALIPSPAWTTLAAAVAALADGGVLEMPAGCGPSAWSRAE